MEILHLRVCRLFIEFDILENKSKKSEKVVDEDEMEDNQGFDKKHSLRMHRNPLAGYADTYVHHIFS